MHFNGWEKGGSKLQIRYLTDSDPNDIGSIGRRIGYKSQMGTTLSSCSHFASGKLLHF
jgi:hypothetical protein